MKKLTALAVGCILATCGALGTSAFGDDTIPCEDMLTTLRKTVKTATMSDADKETVEDLQVKGIARCNADDDVRADAFFTQALTLMGK